jgi:hypothetical protein
MSHDFMQSQSSTSSSSVGVFSKYANYTASINKQDMPKTLKFLI